MYYRDHAHNIKEFLHLKSLFKELIKWEKLKEFTRMQDEEAKEGGNDHVLVHAMHLERAVPTNFGGIIKERRS